MNYREKMIKNNKGQSVVEFLFFLPFIIVLFVMTIAITSSINGAINQQKAARSFFFFISKSNPKYPSLQNLSRFSGRGLKTVGVQVIGWMDYGKGEVPVAPCYSLESLISDVASDTCEAPGASDGDATSKFIRSYTLFGVCSSYVYKTDNQNHFVDISNQAWGSGYCTRR